MFDWIINNIISSYWFLLWALLYSGLKYAHMTSVEFYTKEKYPKGIGGYILRINTWSIWVFICITLLGILVDLKVHLIIISLFM